MAQGEEVAGQRARARLLRAPSWRRSDGAAAAPVPRARPAAEGEPAYIASAAQEDAYRTEPPFKLQGSYRNMNKLAEKVAPVMNDDELERCSTTTTAARRRR